MKCQKCNHDENYHGIHGCFYHNNCDCNYTRYEVQLNAELTALRSQLATVTAEREAMREGYEAAQSFAERLPRDVRVKYFIGGHDVVKSLIEYAAALKGGKV